MEYRIGPHSVFVHSDTIVLTLEGDFRAEHISTVLTLIDGIGGGEGPFYALADVRCLRSVEPEARRIAGAWQGIRRADGTAIVGATVITRALILLVSRASTLLSKTHKKGEVCFFKTEAEARDWLATCRAASRRPA